MHPTSPGRRAAAHGAIALVLGATALAAEARVTRIVIDETVPVPAAETGGVPSERIAGRAFGELDAQHPANAIINDVLLARSPDGKVRYTATFVITKPVDAARASGLMWHEVPNRGNPRPTW